MTLGYVDDTGTEIIISYSTFISFEDSPFFVIFRIKNNYRRQLNFQMVIRKNDITFNRARGMVHCLPILSSFL